MLTDAERALYFRSGDFAPKPNEDPFRDLVQEIGPGLPQPDLLIDGVWYYSRDCILGYARCIARLILQSTLKAHQDEEL